MPRPSIQEMMHLRSRFQNVRQVGSRIKSEIGQRVIPNGTRNRAMREMAQRDSQAIEQRNDLLLNRKLIKKERQRIYEQLLESMGLHGRVDKFMANRDPRIRAMANVIHSIFGANVSAAEVSNLNRIFRDNLKPTSQFMMQSPQLQNAIERIRTGKAKIGSQEHNLLTQASLDILRNNQAGQQILASRGI